MVLKAIYSLDQKYGITLNGEPWVIQNIKKAVGTCICFQKILEMM